MRCQLLCINTFWAPRLSFLTSFPLARLESCFVLVWSDYCTLSWGWGRRSKAGRSTAGGVGLKENPEKWPVRWETVLADSWFIRRGQGIVIPQGEWLVGSMGWYVIGWGKNMEGASFAYSEAAGARERNLQRSQRKERKSSPGYFSDQINSNQSASPCSLGDAAICTGACPWQEKPTCWSLVTPSKAGEQ